MAEEEAAAFQQRVFDLWARLVEAGYGGIDKDYHESTPIEVLEGNVREAEECLALLPRWDNSSNGSNGSYDASEEMVEASARRRSEGLPHEPVPSILRCMVWERLKEARCTLANALCDFERYDDAVPIYKRLIDQALRMRIETWDEGLYVVHGTMYSLGNCYRWSNKYEEAVEWYRKGLRMCERDTPGGSKIEEDIREALDEIMASKAGPVIDGSAGGAEQGKAWKKCWTCCALPTDPGTKLMPCSKCVQLKMATPAYYCSKDCQRKDWGRHKQYHQREKEEKGQRTSSIVCDLNVSEEQLKNRGLPESRVQTMLEYQRLAEDAHRSKGEGDMRNARRLLEKAIKLEPENPSAHYSIAVSVYSECGNYKGMIDEWAETMRLTAEHAKRDEPSVQSSLWARSAGNTAFAFQHNCYVRSGSIPKPDWMQDPDQFLAAAERAVELEPSFPESWGLLGQALEGKNQLPRAIECHQKASQLSIHECNAELYRERAERLASSI